MIKKMLVALSLIGMFGGTVMAADVAKTSPQKQEQTKLPPAQDVLYLGLPVNNSGISLAGRPDRLNFVTVKSDNSVEIDWKNVCLITKQHPFNVQELQKIQGNIQDFILPYALKAANPDHKC